jgi:ELWxxDGT repeat protein
MRWIVSLGACGAVLVGAGGVHAQVVARARLMADVGTAPLSSEPADMHRIGSRAVFTAFTREHGRELWSTDGTGAGTMLVKDIWPGSAWGVVGSGLLPTRLVTPSGEVVLFRGNNGVDGNELWISDGTAMGTRMLKDIWPGNGGSSPDAGFVAGGVLYFSADDGVSGRELWRTDGTEMGTQRIINLGDDSTGQGPIGVNPRVLGVTDSGGLFLGTTLGIVFVDAARTAGTVVSASATYRDGYAVIGEHLYYSYFSTARNDHELWRSDGTVMGTGLFKDVNPGMSINSWPDSFFVARTSNGPRLYFNAVHPQFGYELWASDLTEAGTVFVKDIYPGANGSSPRPFAQVGDRVLVWAPTGVGNIQLLFSDGTEAGTDVLAYMRDGGMTSTAYQGEVKVKREGVNTYFIGLPNSQSALSDVYRVSDPAPGQPIAPPVQMSTLSTGSVGAFAVLPGQGAGGNERIVIGGGSGGGGGAAGVELYRSDLAATTFVADLRPGTGGSDVGWLTPLGTRVMFAARGVSSGLTFQAYGANVDEAMSGTLLPSGTLTIQEPSATSLYAPAVASGPAGPVAVTFAPFTSLGGEPWFTDGTVGGSGPLDLTPGPANSNALRFRSIEGRVVFVRQVGSNFEYWRTDGTMAGTASLVSRGSSNPSQDIVPVTGGFAWAGAPPSQPQGLYRTLVPSGATARITTAAIPSVQPVGAGAGVAYYAASNAASGSELWKTDGTEMGSGMVAEIAAGAAGSLPSGIVGTGSGSAFFQARTAETGNELYFTNGTAAGTVMLADISSGPVGMTVNYSAATTDRHGVPRGVFVINGQLWASDGTPAGTGVLQDLRPDALEQFKLLGGGGGKLYYTANDGVTGQELWETDGTVMGTRRLTNLCPGDCSSIVTVGTFVSTVARVGSRLAFTGDDGTTGLEAWTLDLCPADFNNDANLSVQDIFDFLAAYFAGSGRADVNGVGGVSVQDVFDFLAAWFAGC